MRFQCAQMRSRSTPVCPNALSILSSVLSLDVRQSKCVSYVFKSDLARHPSINMRLLYAQMCSRSTPVYPIALLVYYNALSLSLSAVLPGATRQRLQAKSESFQTKSSNAFRVVLCKMLFMQHRRTICSCCYSCWHSIPQWPIAQAHILAPEEGAP